MVLDSFDKIPKEARSSCGVAAIKLKSNRLEFIHAGDCMIFIEQTNGEIRHLTYDHLSKLDSASIRLFHQTLLSTTDIEAIGDRWNDEQITSKLGEARQKVMPLILENRRKLNTSTG